MIGSHWGFRRYLTPEVPCLMNKNWSDTEEDEDSLFTETIAADSLATRRCNEIVCTYTYLPTQAGIETLCALACIGNVIMDNDPSIKWRELREIQWNYNH